MTLTLKKGDRVQFKEDYTPTCTTGTKATVIDARPAVFDAGQLVDLKTDGGVEAAAYSYRLERIEEPRPEPKFKVGDRVRFKEPYMPGNVGDTGEVIAVTDAGKRECAQVRLDRDPGLTPYPYAHRLERIGVPFRLEVGDRVVNRATGREGIVFKGPISGFLKVADTKPPIKDAVPAFLVEDYEDRHPGTYDLIKKAPW